MKLTAIHYTGIAVILIVAIYYFKKGVPSNTANNAKQKRVASRGGYATPMQMPSTARRQNMGWSFSSCHSLAFWNNFFNPNNIVLQQANCEIYYS